MQPDKLNEGYFMNINQENGWDRKDEDVPEKVMSAKSSH